MPAKLSSPGSRPVASVVPSRRGVLAGAAWSVPAVTIATAAPAFASSEDNPTLVLNVFGNLMSRTGVAGIRVTVRTSTGRPLSGRMLRASLPTEGDVTFIGGGRAQTFGPTGADGVAIVPAVVNPQLADNASATARALTVALTVPATSSSPTRDVTTSINITQRGRALIANVTALSQRQATATFTPRVVGPWYAQSLGASTSSLYYVGSFGGSMTDGNRTDSFTYSAIADPVVVGNTSLVTYSSSGGVTTVSQSSSYSVTPVGYSSQPSGGWTTLEGPGAYSVNGRLHVADPSLDGTPQHLVDYPDKVASRRTLGGRRTVSWTMTSAAGGFYWRSDVTGATRGATHDLPAVPARSTPVGEDVFLTPDRNLLFRGTTSHSPGVTIDSAYAAIVGDDSVATVWYTLAGSNSHFEWRPDGTVTHVTPASVSGSPGSMGAVGYGYFRRGSLHYFGGQEIFWGDARPYVTSSGTGLFGTN